MACLWGDRKAASTEWCIFENPTPGEAINTGVCFDGFEAEVSATYPSGWYDSPLAVQIESPNAEQTVRYTTNGDYPTDTDPVFPEGGLEFDASTVLSVRAWDSQGNSIPSEVNDFTYIIDEFTPEVPTFSILTDEDHLWDWNTGHLC